MTETNKQKFATQVNAELLAALRKLAEDEGRQVQALVDEAFLDLIEKRRMQRPRPHVMAAYQGSLAPFDALYKKLAE
ncbi:MAG: hypothetical protein EBQ96_08690 [Proteobacteria bacterium]|nr:hypothetical protein [Pseudomonadota bacterium]